MAGSTIEIDPHGFEPTSAATIALAATGLEPATVSRVRRALQIETRKLTPSVMGRGQELAYSGNREASRQGIFVRAL
jgi:hypothetical protein